MSTPSSSEILSELAKAGYSMGLTAKKLNIPLQDVREAISSGPKNIEQPPAGEGRADLEAHLVEAKRIEWSWSRTPRMREARRAYNAGTHEMVQHTAKGWCWIYSVPRKEPVPPRKYFNPEDT